MTSWKKWAFGIHSWRFVTFPVVLAAWVNLAMSSPYGLIRGVAWMGAVSYAVAFVLVLIGSLRLPDR